MWYLFLTIYYISIYYITYWSRKRVQMAIAELPSIFRELGSKYALCVDYMNKTLIFFDICTYQGYPCTYKILLVTFYCQQYFKKGFKNSQKNDLAGYTSTLRIHTSCSDHTTYVKFSSSVNTTCTNLGHINQFLCS